MNLERITIDVPKNLRDRMRLYSAVNNISIRAIVNEAVENYLTKNQSSNPFSFIKKAVDIREIVELFIKLEPSGDYFKGPCPFEEDLPMQLTISTSKQIFYCFSCHSGGDVISFVAKMKNISQIEAIDFLKDFVCDEK